jgi:hypothetical protein
MEEAAQTLLENYRFLARYNRWFNERLYDACERLPDEERRRDRGAFFGSIHGSLNHLVWGDRLWLTRFGAQGVAFAALAGDVLVLPPEPGLLCVRVQPVQTNCVSDPWTVGDPPSDALMVVL